MFVCLCKAFPWDSSIIFQVKTELLVQRKSFVSHESRPPTPAKHSMAVQGNPLTSLENASSDVGTKL